MLIYGYPDLKKNLLAADKMIRSSKRILLISGNNPDGDSIGSMFALYDYCQSLNIPTDCFCITKIPESLLFLPLPQIVDNPSDIPPEIDLAIMFDLGSLSQTNLNEWLAVKNPIIINVDHHQTNERFGNINIVSTKAAATTELIYNLFRVAQYNINKHTATALLTGLITDTDSLSNPATSPSAMSMASDLIKMGGNLKMVINFTLKNKSLTALRLWGDIIHNLQHNNTWDITTAIIPHQQLKVYDANDEWLEGLANFLTVLSNTKIILVLRETEPDKFKASLRTTKEDIDVEELARIFDGGGHRKAAGFSISGKLDKLNGSWYIS